jgi:hypothetical protein
VFIDSGACGAAGDRARQLEVTTFVTGRQSQEIAASSRQLIEADAAACTN